MDDQLPGIRPADLFGRQACVLEPALVEVVGGTGRVGRPHDLRHRVCELAVPLLARPLERVELLLVQLHRLLLDLAALLPQLDEHRDLRAQDVRVDRLEDVVDRAGRVAAIDVRLVLRERRHEDDRDVPRALALLDQRRELEAVEVRHLDVEQDAREVVEQELLQRGGARTSPRRAGARAARGSPRSASRFSLRSSTRRTSPARCRACSCPGRARRGTRESLRAGGSRRRRRGDRRIGHRPSHGASRAPARSRRRRAP